MEDLQQGSVNQQQPAEIRNAPAAAPDSRRATMSGWPLLGVLVLGFCLSVGGEADERTGGERGVLQLDGETFARALREHPQLLVLFCEFPPAG